MRLGDRCQAHRCAGRRVGSTRITETELAARNRRAGFPAPVSFAATSTKRGSAARGPLQTGAAAQHRHAAGGQRVILRSVLQICSRARAAVRAGQRERAGLDHSKTRLQRDGRAGLGTQRGSRAAWRKARFSPPALAAPARTAARAISEICRVDERLSAAVRASAPVSRLLWASVIRDAAGRVILRNSRPLRPASVEPHQPAACRDADGFSAAGHAELLEQVREVSLHRAG